MVTTFVVQKSRDRAKFPKTTQNGSSESVVEQIYTTPSAPFDQCKLPSHHPSEHHIDFIIPYLSTPLLIGGAAFYLIINLSAGGTSGWFPDEIGNKPWFDSSNSKFVTTLSSFF